MEPARTPRPWQHLRLMPTTFVLSVVVVLALAFAPPTREALRVPKLSEAEAMALVANSDVPVVLTFSVPGCHFCHAALKMLIEVAGERPALRYAEVDLSEAEGLRERLGITGVPTQLLFSSGRVVHRTAGFNDAAALDRALTGVR